MESGAKSLHLPPLAAPHEREAIGKQLHWSVVRPESRTARVYLDKLVDSWRELADAVAERAAALGVAVDVQARTVADGSDLRPVPPGPVEAHLAVWEMTRRVAEVAERIRSRLAPVAEIDLVSQDALLDVVRALEKQQWLLRVQLGERT